MKNYTIKEVVTKKDENLFLDMVNFIYSGDINYIRPLDNDVTSVFDRSKNERFNGGDAKRWLAFDGSQVVGRIAAFFNYEESAKEKQPTGGVGFFESVNNQDVANALFDTAKMWLQGKGMQAMDGSINFGDRLSWWGVLVDGFSDPIYGMPYNPPYYQTLFENYGFQNYFNQHTYSRVLNKSLKLDDVLYAKAERLLENPEYKVTCYDKKHKLKMAHDFMTVYNSGWANFEGVKPLTMEHTKKLLKTMSPIIDPQVLLFAYHNETPIGFFVTVPDINLIIKKFNGKFNLIHKLRFIYNLKIKKSVNRIAGLIFGVSQQYQGKGVETALIKTLEDYAFKRVDNNNVQYESLQMAWVGDFNPVMMRMCEGYVKATKFKRHVTYRHLFDPNATFERCPRLGSKK